MYIIERLKKDYPQYADTLEEYNRYLRRYHGDDLLQKIYDDGKEHFYWVNKAFKCGPGKPGYNKNMAYYEMAINFDLDFLRSLVKNSEKLDVEQLRKKLLGKSYDPDRDKELLNKLKDRND